MDQVILDHNWNARQSEIEIEDACLYNPNKNTFCCVGFYVYQLGKCPLENIESIGTLQYAFNRDQNKKYNPNRIPRNVLSRLYEINDSTTYLTITEKVSALNNTANKYNLKFILVEDLPNYDNPNILDHLNNEF